MTVPITLKVNGREHRLEVKPNELLLNVLRDRLGLTGTKYGCGLGECGACTVLLKGRAILSCQTLAVSVAGREITTIEGLSALADGAATDGTAKGAAAESTAAGLGTAQRLHPLQEAFIEEGAVQCGFCTPGMILSAKALLDKNPDHSNAEIRYALRGNFCRCTGYISIVQAVKAAARRLQEKNRR